MHNFDPYRKVYEGYLFMLFKMYGKSYSVYFHPVALCKHPNTNNSHFGGFVHNYSNSIKSILGRFGCLCHADREHTYFSLYPS